MADPHAQKQFPFPGDQKFHLKDLTIIRDTTTAVPCVTPISMSSFPLFLQTGLTILFEQVEKLIHKTIDRLTDLRIRQNREFFNVSPAKALDILKDISTTLDDAEIDEVYLGENRKNTIIHHNNDTTSSIKRHQRPRFRFSMVNIPIGATLIFTPTGTEVKVADDDKVEYQGRLYKLSPFVGTFMPINRRNSSGAYQGAKYFSYKGEILDDIRTKIESNE